MASDAWVATKEAIVARILPPLPAGHPRNKVGGRMTTVKATIGDERLIRDTVSGDTRAWNVLVDRVYPQVWAIAAAELDDVTAREVCDVVLLRLAQRLHGLTDAVEAIDWARDDATDECRRARTKEQRATPPQFRNQKPSAVDSTRRPADLGLPARRCDAV